MEGVKRLEGINIKKCRGESKLAVLTSPPGQENWKTSRIVLGRYGEGGGGEEKVERFKRHAMRSWIRKPCENRGEKRGRQVNGET